eukprot:scaffold29027_cov18-Prasinocladus_malaysianus.AAC.1
MVWLISHRQSWNQNTLDKALWAVIFVTLLNSISCKHISSLQHNDTGAAFKSHIAWLCKMDSFLSHID